MDRRNVLTLLAGATLGGVVVAEPSAQAQDRSFDEHFKWVSEVLEKMQSIKPGMTRERLLTVFTTEGGLSVPLQRTFVSRDCPCFKVKVVFKAVSRPSLEADGGTTEVEDSRDTIHSISVPYLQFPIAD